MSSRGWRLEIDDREDGYRFAHGLTHEVLFQSLSTRRRTRLHRRIASELPPTPDRDRHLAVLAYHLSEGSPRRQADWMQLVRATGAVPR